MIKREIYMSRIRPFIGNELIKVLTGIRRSGKSVMLSLIQEELAQNGVQPEQFISLNFENMSNAHLCTAVALHDEILRRTKEISGKVYLFFDEIQEVADWEKCINSFRVELDCVSVDGTDVRKIPTKHLRDMESYVTQETHLFHDSIANNIAIAKPGASREEIMEAAKKASIHDFIMTLPKGYDTEVGELGDTLSGGEKQRIGIARAFLHECPLILLDEPTSNLDSLNEGIILKSLKESAKKKTVVLVSHRVSTMNVADVVYEMENGRIS